MNKTQIYQIDKKTWYKWSFYINIVVFIIIAISVYLLFHDAYVAGSIQSDGGAVLTSAMLYVVRDVAFLAICLTYIFVQLFKYQRIIILRNW